MKKHILTLTALMGFAVLAFAQPEKGDMMVASNLTASYNDYKVAGLKQGAQGGVNIDMLNGHCFGKGYVFGMGVHYSNYFSTNFDGNGIRTNRSMMHSVGPLFFSRHFARLTDKLYLRSGINMGYYANLNSTRDFLTNSRTPWGLSHTFDIRVRMGVVFFPKPNIGIEFSYGEIGYNVNFAHVIDHSFNHPKSVQNNFNFKYGVDGIQVGIVYFMNHKKMMEERKAAKEAKNKG